MNTGRVGGLAGVAVIVAVWWLASVLLFRSSGAIPTPPSVLAKFADGGQWTATIHNATSTVTSAAKGYLWGNLAAIALAVLVLLVPRLEPLANQVAIVTYCIPLVAIGPVIVIVAGRSSPAGASVALAAMSCFFTTVVGCLLGLRAAPRASIDLVRAYGGTAWTTLRKVQLISALPSLFAALRIAAPATFLGAILAEYLGSGGDATLGRALIAAQTQSDAPQLWYLALVSGLISGLGYLVVGLVARIVAPWTTGVETPGRWAMTAVLDTPRAGTVAGPVLRRAGRSLLTIVVAVVVLGVLWTALLKLFGVSAFVGKSPFDVGQYLFSDAPARGVRPTSLSASGARAASFGALGTTLVNAAIGFVSGMVIATAVAVGFVLWRPFELAFMPIALLLRSVPLVAMAPLLLLVFGQGKLGVAVIAGIVVLFPALVNIVLGLTSASQAAVDVVRVNGGSALSVLLKVRIPAALPQFLASARISVPGAIVGSMLAEWLVGFEGMGGVLSGYKGQGNYGGVWTIVALSVLVSIVLYEVMTIVETALLARWGPEAGVAR